MTSRAYILALVASLGMFACGGSAQTGEAKAPESDPWAGYTGKYTSPGASTPSSPSKAKRAAAEAPPADDAESGSDAKALYGSPSESAEAPKAAAKKTSKAAKKTAKAAPKKAAKKPGKKVAKR
jgi:hypothetical protein